jgi:hypothetical protein
LRPAIMKRSSPLDNPLQRFLKAMTDFGAFYRYLE